MDTNALADLHGIYSPIEAEIEELKQFLDVEFSSEKPFIREILEHVAEFRGKQIRPALLFLVNRLSGAEPSPDHVKIAAVLELIHTATLVHDDVLDDARLRRNMKTVHLRWGQRAAVLIGDFIYSRAFRLSTDVPGMARILSDTTHTICEGELLQIGTRFRPDMGEATYFEIIRKKTAILYAVSCQLGGVLGNLDADQCRAFHGFGMDLGMAFQIVDDCLDYAGKEQEAGKSLGTDLHQGKVTLPLIYLMESLPQNEGRWLKEVLRQPFSAETEARIHGMIEEHGVVREALSRASSFLQSAKVLLAESVGGTSVSSNPNVRQARESLDWVADYIVRRQR